MNAMNKLGPLALAVVCVALLSLTPFPTDFP